MIIPISERPDKELFYEAREATISFLEGQGKRVIFLAVSGSHSCGLERPDSDIDIRGIYADPLSKVVGLYPGRDNIEKTFTISIEDRSVEVDIQCYEIAKVLRMLDRNNGNIVRLLLSPLILYSAYDQTWQNLGSKYLTKNLLSYYLGYASSQRKKAIGNKGGKALTYTYRELFEGYSLFKLGYPIFDFKESWDLAKTEGLYSHGLLSTYFDKPNELLSTSLWNLFYQEWEELCEKLKEVCLQSSIPDSFNGIEILEKLLLRYRAKELCANCCIYLKI